ENPAAPLTNSSCSPTTKSTAACSIVRALSDGTRFTAPDENFLYAFKGEPPTAARLRAPVGQLAGHAAFRPVPARAARALRPLRAIAPGFEILEANQKARTRFPSQALR